MTFSRNILADFQDHIMPTSSFGNVDAIQKTIHWFQNHTGTNIWKKICLCFPHSCVQTSTHLLNALVSELGFMSSWSLFHLIKLRVCLMLETRRWWREFYVYHVTPTSTVLTKDHIRNKFRIRPYDQLIMVLLRDATQQCVYSKYWTDRCLTFVLIRAKLHRCLYVRLVLDLHVGTTFSLSASTSLPVCANWPGGGGGGYFCRH